MLPKRLERKTVYESDWINLFVDKVQLSSGYIVEKYHQINFHRDSVCVLAFNKKREICFIRSLRYSTGRVEWELPAGAIEKDETPLAAGVREFREETGCELTGSRCGLKYHPLVGVTDHLVHIVRGKVESDGPKDFTSDETAGVHWFDREKIRRMIRDNEITDGVSLMPLLLYLAKIAEEVA